MHLAKKVFKVLVILLTVLVAAIAAFVWWTNPKRPVDSVFVHEAGPGVYKFTDVARGRALSAHELDEHARKILAGMTLQEKVLQMSGDTWLWELAKLSTIEQEKYNDRPITAGADRRLAIPPIAFSDGPRGVVLDHSTCFPSAMLRGASWDRELQRRVGDAIAKEIRAQGGNLWGGMCVNLLRHPSWGRAQETLGEDPYLIGELAAPAVAAVQAHNVMACAKHFALNSIEETRTEVDVHVDERTLREVYLPAFKRLADADVAAFMSAYNKVDGEYCGENRHLLRDILKAEWRFSGFVMSDFFAGVHDGVKAALAGLDLEMPMTRVYGRKLQEAVERGDVEVGVVDEAVLRLLRRKLDYATCPDPIAYPKALVRAPEHVALAREAAEKGIVVLENDGTLPLEPRTLRSVAVVGRLADAPNLGDYGSSRVYPPKWVTVVDGLREALGPARVLSAPGADVVRAREAARRADAAVVVVGFDQSDEGEWIPQKAKADERGGDREDLALKAVDREMVQAIAAENRRTIVVLVGGAAITVEEWHERVPAILMAFYPGEQGGAAVARVLTGAVNPSGKLPFTVPKDLSQLPPFDNRSLQVDYGYYHGYTLVEKRGWQPRYCFGYGLSYTRFAYAHLTLDATTVPADGVVTVSVDVTNTGGRAGEEIAQLYVGFPGARVDRPVKLLRGFEKLALEPGETKRASFRLEVKDLAYYDVLSRSWKVEPTTYTVMAGPSSRTADLVSASLTVTD
jgi:beta-glucosidase